MPQDTTPDAYHAQPDEAFHGSPAALPADFKIIATEPPPDFDFKQSGGRFLKGHDPRRHRFTPAEHSAGFWSALASYAERRSNPRYFLRRKMRARGQSFRPTPKGRRGLVAA